MPTRRGSTVRAKDAIPAVERAVRATVRGAAHGLHVEKKWAADWEVGRDLVLAVSAFSHHVGIEFWRGASLPDPSGLLEGSGKNLRHAKIRSVAEAESPALKRLIRAAVALDTVSEKRTR